MTADEVLATAAATRASIVDLDAGLAERVDAIEDAAFNTGRALTRLRGLGGFSILRPLPINGLAGKVCTTGVGWGCWL